jgi:hypothetical protein
VEDARVDESPRDVMGVERLPEKVLEGRADAHPAAVGGVERGELAGGLEAGQAAVQLEDPARTLRQRPRFGVDRVELTGRAESLELEVLRRHW